MGGGGEETQFSAKNLAPISSSDRGQYGARSPSFSMAGPDENSQRGELQFSPLSHRQDVQPEAWGGGGELARGQVASWWGRYHSNQSTHHQHHKSVAAFVCERASPEVIKTGVCVNVCVCVSAALNQQRMPDVTKEKSSKSSGSSSSSPMNTKECVARRKYKTQVFLRKTHL